MGVYRSKNYREHEARKYRRTTAGLLIALAALVLAPVIALLVEVMS